MCFTKYFGMNWMDVLLNGTPIAGSPVTFKSVPGSADARQSYIEPPQEAFCAEADYELTESLAQARLLCAQQPPLSGAVVCFLSS